LAAQGVLVALGLALFVAPFASGWPDGLERVATRLGFGTRATATRALATPLPGYRIPGVVSPVLSTALAGAAGTLVAFALAWLLAALLTPPRSAGTQSGGKGAAPDAPRAA